MNSPGSTTQRWKREDQNANARSSSWQLTCWVSPGSRCTLANPFSSRSGRATDASHVPDVHLNDLGSSPLTNVADRRSYGHRKIAACDRPGDRNLDIVDAEAGVGQAKPKRVTHVLDRACRRRGSR